MRNTNTNPVLRFPEFKGVWKKETLDKVFFKKSIKNKGSNVKTVLTNSAVQGIILQNDYFDKEIANQNNLEGYYLVEVDDFVYNPRISVSAPVGPLKRNKLCLGVMSPLYTILKNIKGELGFFEYYFETRYWYKYMRSIANYGVRHDRMNITSEGFQKLPVPFPSLDEQKKIADFLIQIDNRITQLSEKKEYLELYKKGITQKIFSQKLRFKDENGKDFPDWQTKKFEKIFKRVTTKNIENNNNVLTISAQHGLINQQDFFNKSVSANDVTGYYLIKKGDFAYNKSYSKGYPMGAIKPLKKYEKGVVSTLYICFNLIDNSNPDFYEHYFESGKINKQIHKIAQEGARNHGLLNLSVVEFFKDIDILEPHIKEQEKIASFLNEISQQISFISEQLEETRIFKKGLLQNMFI